MPGDAGLRAPRRRKLKVYLGNYDGRREVLGAFHSLVDFVQVSRASRAYCHETFNDEDCTAALARPGAVLIRAINARSEVPWTVLRAAQPGDRDGAAGGEGTGDG